MSVRMYIILINYKDCTKVKFSVKAGQLENTENGTRSGNGNGNILSGRMRITLMNGRGSLLMAE